MNNPIYTQIDSDIVYCDDAFTSEELLTIRTIGDSLKSKGHVDATTGDGTSRKVWEVGLRHAPSDTTRFIYKKIAALVKEINTRFFQLDISGISDYGIWYTTYVAPTDHMDWHADKTVVYGGISINEPVKLTLVLQVTDPSEYEGGIVEIMTDDGVEIIEKKVGRIYAIPGYLVHRVTPVTSGERHVLLTWYIGPKFK